MRVTSFVLGNFVTTEQVEEADETLKKRGNSAEAGNGGWLLKGQVDEYFMGNQGIDQI